MRSEEMTVWSRFGENGTEWVESYENDEALYSFLGYDATLKSVLVWENRRILTGRIILRASEQPT